jgi:hypothetical protein
MANLLTRIFGSANIVWTIACAIGGAAFGAAVGSANAGIIGAIAVAFCGLILGALFSKLILEALLRL